MIVSGVCLCRSNFYNEMVIFMGGCQGVLCGYCFTTSFFMFSEEILSGAWKGHFHDVRYYGWLIGG